MLKIDHTEKDAFFRNFQEKCLLTTSFLTFILRMPMDLKYHLKQEFQKYFV